MEKKTFQRAVAFVAAALAGLMAISTAARAQDSVFELQPEQTCLDAGCHADINSKKILHKPASKSSTCKMCHKSGTPTQHDFELATSKNQLCTRCHKMVKDQKSQHMPAKRGMCLNCHEPHQSDNRNLLKKAKPGELCKGCHRKVGQDGESKHGPVSTYQCTACHNPHASEEKHLLKAKEPELCINCHSRPLKAEDGQRLRATGPDLDDENLQKHMPFKAGRCSMCHLPHSSENYRLLKKPYPAEFYAPFSEDSYFCFSCHKGKSFTEPRTVTDTAFRNGNLNLHFRHVNKTKGRTCRACHDHHASQFQKLIRSSVEFGSGQIEISNFELTENGGTCAPLCHLPVSYDRLSPIEVGMKMSPRVGQDASKEELYGNGAETESLE